jgi:hypothetical protein
VYEAVTTRRVVRGLTDGLPEGGAGARTVRRDLVAVRIEPPAVEYLRGDRRAGRTQERAGERVAAGDPPVVDASYFSNATAPAVTPEPRDFQSI